MNQFQWLQNVLQSSRMNCESVIIAGHIPSGEASVALVESYALKYVDAINEFSDIIIAQLYGHTHNDQVNLFLIALVNKLVWNCLWCFKSAIWSRIHNQQCHSFWKPQPKFPYLRISIAECHWWMWFSLCAKWLSTLHHWPKRNNSKRSPWLVTFQIFICWCTIQEIGILSKGCLWIERPFPRILGWFG